jgi:predicted HicB family RNase H-like nuclease
MSARSAPAVKYDSRLNFVLPSRVADAVTKSAQEKMQSVNSWLRLACIEQLAKDGVSIRETNTVRSHR